MNEDKHTLAMKKKDIWNARCVRKDTSSEQQSVIKLP